MLRVVLSEMYLKVRLRAKYTFDLLAIEQFEIRCQISDCTLQSKDCTSLVNKAWSTISGVPSSFRNALNRLFFYLSKNSNACNRNAYERYSETVDWMRIKRKAKKNEWTRLIRGNKMLFIAKLLQSFSLIWSECERKCIWMFCVSSVFLLLRHSHNPLITFSGQVSA